MKNRVFLFFVVIIFLIACIFTSNLWGKLRNLEPLSEAMTNKSEFYYIHSSPITESFYYQWRYFGVIRFEMQAYCCNIRKINNEKFRLSIKIKALETIDALLYRSQKYDDFFINIDWTQNEKDTTGKMKNVVLKELSESGEINKLIKHKFEIEHIGSCFIEQYGEVNVHQIVLEFGYSLKNGQYLKKKLITNVFNKLYITKKQ